MKGYNPPQNIDVEGFLTGFDDEKYIRDISASNFTNKVKVFIRKPSDERASIKEYTFTPFLWSKELPNKIKKDFFKWKTVGLPLTAYTEGQESVILDGNMKLIDNEKVKYLGLTLDNEQHIFTWELSNEDERLTYYNQKKKEYGIDIKEQITYYKGQEKNDRMESGFKYLVKIITKERPTYTSNPLYLWNSKGKKNRITGSFQNLVNFYREGGIDIYQRGGDFINQEKLISKFDGLKLSKKILLYFDIINELRTKGLEMDFFDVDFVDKNELYKFISTKPIIKAQIVENLELSGETFKFSKVNLLKLMKLADVKEILKLAFEEDKLSILFPNVGLNLEAVEDFVSLKRNFRANGVGRLLVEKLKGDNFDFFNSFEKLFYTIPVVEQFMIQSGKRLFKGIENYDDLRIMTLDIETEAHPNFPNYPKAALFPEYGRIFKIGIYVNDGFQEILEAKTDEEELEILIRAYQLIAEKDPDLFLTYNGESFDIPFMEKRLELVGGIAEDKDGNKSAEQFIRNLLSPYYQDYSGYINDYSLYNRRSARLKSGSTSESYTQTHSLGRSFCDTMFAVKRAAAQNKGIPNLKLKDNIKYANIAKPNRVYVEGNKIGELENDSRTFYLNEETGHYFTNNKTIEFFRGDFTKNHVKISQKGANYYYSSKRLFIYTIGEDVQNQSIVSNCINSHGITCFHNGRDIISDLSRFKKAIDISFDKLYKKIGKYDYLIAPITGIGSSFKKTHPEHFQYLRDKLTELRNNFKDIKKMYPDVNFEEYSTTTGTELVKKYLIDDLWETYELDKIYSQATFEVAKWLPTTYQKAATQGTATIWKQLLTGWSYMNGLGIPDYERERNFNGGLVGMVSSGYHKDITKIDFSSMYPADSLENGEDVDIDISNIYKPFLRFALKTRLKFKKLKVEASASGNHK